MEGEPKDQDYYNNLIKERIDALRQDRQERKQVYSRRRDFYTGNQGDYSNIVGIVRDSKQKKGHTNQVINYAGKTVVKTAFGLANNPPKLTVPPLDQTDPIEAAKAQAIEEYQDSIFDDSLNKFWKKAYRRACFVQGEYGDAAIKTYPLGGKIKICGHEDMSTISVGWNGNPGEFDFVIVEMMLSAQNIKEQYGIKVNEKLLGKYEEKEGSSGSSWEDNNQWGTKSSVKMGQSTLPSGKTKIPKVKVIEYDDLDVYAIQIEDELVQLVFKDDVKFPRILFWTIVPNIPNPPSPWSIADIDYLIDPQIELNDNNNRTADHLRVGNVQRYVAYNMKDFDASSISTSSGQVIQIDDPTGLARFEPLQTNINNFPDDQYNQRLMGQIYDMGLPKVNYGASGADSGRSKAIDYQSSIDLTQFKRDSWELALQEVCEKIQVLGNFLLGQKVDWFADAEGNFVVRPVEFDWTDILPVSQSDKIVNVANKFNMIGIPLKQAFKELGYRNAEAMVEQLKQELADPNMMVLRAKAWQLSEGLLMAQNQAATLAQSNSVETPPPANGAVNQGSPMLTQAQNSESSRPMAAKGGTTAYSSAAGLINRVRQNNQARGG